eukprot:1245453-Rhodomonas_salina.7
MPGTDIGSLCSTIAMRCPVLRSAMRYQAYGHRRLVPRRRYPRPTPLRACYAKPGTDLAYAATRFRESTPSLRSYGTAIALSVCYAKSGTDRGSTVVLLSPCASSMPSPVLTWYCYRPTPLLCQVRY